MIWPAYRLLHEHLQPSSDPLTADPFDLVGPLRHYGITKAYCLLHSHDMGDTLQESGAIVGGLLAMCEMGVRPRTLGEVGMQREDFA